MSAAFAFGAAACAAVLFWALLYALSRETSKRGQAEAFLENQHDVLNDVDKANAARDRLRRDSSYAERLRLRFTRKP